MWGPIWELNFFFFFRKWLTLLGRTNTGTLRNVSRTKYFPAHHLKKHPVYQRHLISLNDWASFEVCDNIM